MEKLKPELFDLLIEVLTKHQPSMLDCVTSRSEVNLTYNERKIVMDSISDEFIKTGQKEDLEPNARGLLLEELLDVVNPVNDELRGSKHIRRSDP